MLKRNLPIRTSLCVLLISMVLFSFRTGDDVHPKVLEQFGQETVTFWENNNPRILAYHTYYVDHGWYITDAPEGKDMSSLQTVDLPLINGKINRAKMNVLKLNIQRQFDQDTYIKVNGSSEMLVIYSEKTINARFNEYYSKSKN